MNHSQPPKTREVISTNSGQPSAQGPVLVAEGLRKTYGPREALKSLSFSLDAGRVLGFLGPNGAGKTTSIRILTTSMEPTAGQFSVDGIPSSEPERIRRRIGVLPENLGLPKHMTGIEYLTFYGRLFGRSASDAKAASMGLLEAMGLQKRAKSLIGTYSHGMRQRLGIARALVNDPVVVFFDEPTLGLDPRGQQELLTLVRRVARERNAGVILCSHALSEIESVCDDVVILSSGEVVAAGTVAAVIGRTQQEVVRRSGIRIHVAPPALAEALRRLEEAPGVAEVAATDAEAGWLRVELQNAANGMPMDDQSTTNHLLAALIQGNVPILSFQADGGGLQDAFLHLTEEVIQ